MQRTQQKECLLFISMETTTDMESIITIFYEQEPAYHFCKRMVPKVMLLVLLYFPTKSEVDVGGVTVEGKHFHQ